MNAKILGTALLSLLLVSCGTSEAPVAKPVKDVAAYNTVFKDMFRSNQTATTDIPKKGVYDFEITANADGDGKKLESFAGKTFGEAFQSLSTRFYGDYDFENPDSASFVSTIKAYLNKENT